MIKYISKSGEDTYKLAKILSDRLSGGEVVLLSGDLGAGKTTFTKGLAQSLGVDETVTSPTFTFMKEYEGRLRLYHFDMYRVCDEDELYELGLNEYLYMNGVCVIEWNKFEDVPKPINIQVTSLDDDKREFAISGIDLDLSKI
ncbi:MAG: tRNA (adenosine(37)-N6)-threonylcarbamoyltransferase complex ATPase subunit type 1 TsaE [Clostridia bacterium]|nr:tRNA (adenosine(37)-N6)-threonylcarbamoyltransferase complex ATPase subunit type 1 TsaE [Clostridia bacterium]